MLKLNVGGLSGRHIRVAGMVGADLNRISISWSSLPLMAFLVALHLAELIHGDLKICTEDKTSLWMPLQGTTVVL